MPTNVRTACLLATMALLAGAVSCKGPSPVPGRSAKAVAEVPRENLSLPPEEDVRQPPIVVPESMVHVPRGAFRMGCDEAVDGPCSATERPSRAVWVNGFFVDVTEVTVGAFTACVKAGSCSLPISDGECNFGEADRDVYAINCVTWDQAAQFCAWQGKRLPTEAEWEKAARGTDGRPFPWGRDAADAGGTYRANWGEGLARNLWIRDQWEYDGPVGFYPNAAGPYGTEDQAGNVSEWVADGYREGYDPNDTRDPKVGPTAEGRVVRGGSFREYARRMKTFARDWHEPTFWYSHVGFRCASDAPR
jgi:formylglycine-generating enzyme required for sulfatase activity